MIALGVTYFYALLCAVCLWCAAHSAIRDRRHAVMAATALCLGCYLSNTAWWLGAIPAWVRIDAPAMLFFLALLWVDRRDWKRRLAIVSVAVMGTHAIFAQVDDGWPLKPYVYPAALNALFVLQLFIVGRIGAKGAWDRGSTWLVSLRGRRSGGIAGLLRRRPDQ